MNYEEFIHRVAKKAGLDTAHAEVATQVVLSALGERLSDKEARDLASQLSRVLKPMLQNVPGHGKPYSAAQFVGLVAEREGVSESEARLHAQAVLSTVLEAVDRGELSDIFAELWHDAAYDELWVEPSSPVSGDGGAADLARGR